MSERDDVVVVAAVSHALHVLKGLRGSSFRDYAQARAAFRELHFYITGSYFQQVGRGVPGGNPQSVPWCDAVNPVPTFLGFARTALLHLQQQQCILQAPAADMTLISMICESLSSAILLPNSNPAAANEAQQLLHDAGPGEK
jgi:hypothetical protein